MPHYEFFCHDCKKTAMLEECFKERPGDWQVSRFRVRNLRPLAKASCVKSMVQTWSGRTGSFRGTRAAAVGILRRPRSRKRGSSTLRRRYRQVARCTCTSPQARRSETAASERITPTACLCICGPTTFL